MDAKSDLREASIAAVVVRADGSREDLGVVSYWHKSWFRRAIWRVSRWRQS